MSTTYELVCHETKKKIWIGQSGIGGRCIYHGSKKVMQRLANFLFEHQGMPLEFLSDSEVDKLHDYEDFEPEPEET